MNTDNQTNDWKGKTLFHYTSIESCLAILQNKSIRLSNIHYLNDSMEYFWLWEIFNRVFKEMGQDPSRLQWIRDKYVPEYIFCFCELGDFLPLWRSYTNDGRGVSIGFEVCADAQDHYEKNSLRCERVIYDPDEQEKLVREQIQRMGLLVNSGVTPDGDDDDAVNKNIADIFLHINLNWHASLCKNPGFESEKEWRLIFTQGREPLIPMRDPPVTPTLKFRTASTNILPFIELPILPANFGVLRLRKIIFGPRNEFRAQGAGLRELLKSIHIDPTEIEFERSKISYVG